MQEPAPCLYEFYIKSPYACNPAFTHNGVQRLFDELLGIDETLN
jgi:hypothetical protein